MESKWLALGLPVAAAGAASLLVFFTIAKATSAQQGHEAWTQSAEVPAGACVAAQPDVEPCAADMTPRHESDGVCPITGESGPSSLSWDEVMERLHSEEAADKGGCPYLDEHASPPGDRASHEDAIWL
ncbi:MAG: hypothetical protein ACOC1F_11245 [Myxococcota bacterium]